MLAHVKIATQTQFSQKLLQAFRRYRELCKGDNARLSAKRKHDLAVRAAHDHQLSYVDGEVDPLITTAILAFANKDTSELERANALHEAWEAYDNSWINRTLH